MKKKSSEKSLESKTGGKQMSDAHGGKPYSNETDIFERENYTRMTIRLPNELSESLERFVNAKTSKQRQKIKVITLALEKFLREQGYYE